MPAPVITVAQMREWEKATWASGQSEEAVIRLAGAAVARHAEKMTRPGGHVLVLAGKGHNGNDARLAADQLRDRTSEVLPVGDPEQVEARLTQALARRPDLIIDGLFGIGLNRPLAAPWIQLLRRVNQSRVPVLAVDIPSGLHADLGVPLEDAIRATRTLTLAAAKAGMIESTAWPFVGRLEVAPEIGLIPYPFEAENNLVLAEDFRGFPPPRAIDSHKGSHGHVVIIAGSLGYHGACVLAARAAQRARPGLVTVFTSEGTYLPVAAQLSGAMVQPWSESLRLPENCTAILAGPGLAAPAIPEEVKKAVRHYWQESPAAMVVDASALDWIPPGWCKKNAIRVLTPHPGEAARLLKTTASEVQNHRGRALRDLSRCWGDCHVVLKGHQTMTGGHKEGIYINGSGNSHLAQGGTGDVLAGYLAGLLAQPALQNDPNQAIRYAVWQHGAAADLLTQRQSNWVTDELPAILGLVPPEE